MKHHVLNYFPVIIISILSVLYFLGSRDAEYHLMTVLYAPYFDHMELITAFLFQVLGVFLLSAGFFILKLKVTYNQQKAFWLARYILLMEIFILVGVVLDLQMFQILKGSFLINSLLITGLLSSVLVFLKARKAHSVFLQNSGYSE